MGSLPIQWGDVASWVQALGGLAQLGHVIYSEHLRRAQDFAARLQSETGLEDEQLAAAVTRHGEVERLVFEGFEAAARAATEEKRWLLARVVAAALEGDDARINEVDVLFRTVATLEPYHVRTLVMIATPRPGKGQLAGTRIEGAFTDEELAASLPDDQDDLIGPILAVLDRESLVRDVGVGRLDYQRAWSITDYGRRLLTFVPGIVDTPPFDIAHVVAVYAKSPAALYVRNLGPGPAELSTIEVSCDGDPIGTPPALPRPLLPGHEMAVSCNTIPPNAGVRVLVEWSDPQGRQKRFADTQFPR